VGVVWGCEIRWKEIVSLGVVWANVSERYLKVSRIFFDHHRVLNSSDPNLCHIYDVEGFSICLECICVAVVVGSYYHDTFVSVVF